MGLTPDQQQFFDDMEELFATRGWKRLMEEANSTIYALQADALEAKTWEQVLVMRGKAEQLAELANMEDTVAISKAQAIAANMPDYPEEEGE